MNSSESLTITERLEAALAYAQVQGWRVLPCHTYVDRGCTCEDANCGSKAKHPLTPNGCKDATTDPQTITNWWVETEGYPNVGIATGAESGLVVGDVDISSGGMDSLAEWEKVHGPMPPTPTAQTGSGGLHYYFRYPTGTKVGNRTGIVPGIDVRGDGGYVLAPPSLHASGGSYVWLQPPQVPLADLPEWLFDLICGPRSVPEPSSTEASSAIVMSLARPQPDLTNCPGVGQGQRHNALCRLVGVHLARGDAVEMIEAAALAWGSQCHPPLGSIEVIRTVRSLAVKHDSQQPRRPLVAPHDNVELVALPEPQPRPELHPDALTGLSGEIVRTLEPHTEADPVGVLLTFLGCFGNAVGKGPYFSVGADCHHANLFVGLVGDTASGKGQAWGIARSLMRSADPEWEAECVCYGLSSGEGLVERVKDDEPDESDKGSILVLPAVKRLLCYESEFAKPITAMRREGNTLSALLRAAWDSQTLEVMTRGKSKLKASNAHIGIVAHVTPDELGKLLSGSIEIANGFANRFLWCHVQRSRLLPHGGDSGVLDPFATPLANALIRAKAIGRVRRNLDADRLWESVYASLAEARAGAFGRATERARPQVLRLALIYALLDGSPTITAEHLRPALAVWRYCEASARIIFSPVDADSDDPLEQQVLSIIRLNPGVNRKGLHKALGGHIPASTLVKALAKLRDRGLIRTETVSTGGRPSECWWPIQIPSTPLMSTGSSSASVVTVSAKERTKPEEKEEAQAVAVVGADKQATEDCSFVRTEAAPESGQGGCEETSPLSLADLFITVRDAGGKIVRSDDGYAVQGMENPLLTPAILTALVAHRSELDSIMPSTPPSGGVKPYPSPTPTSDAEPLPRCSCGALVERPGDEICSSCFQAELAALC